MNNHAYQYIPFTQAYYGIDPQQKDDPFTDRYYVFPPGMEPKEELEPFAVANGIKLKTLNDDEDIFGIYITLTNKGESTAHVGVPLSIAQIQLASYNVGEEVALYASRTFAANCIYLTDKARAHIAGYINGLCERIRSEQ